MTKTLAPVHPYYMIKAYQWLHDHGAKPETDPTPLARWAEHSANTYDDWRWAAVTEDGEVVGEAYPCHSIDSTDYYLTLETSRKYGFTHTTLRPAAELALPAIAQIVKKNVIWAKQNEFCGHVWLSERALYAEAKAKYRF